MFEKFTDRARKVMALANQEAQHCNHEYVDTGHMLIATLIEENGVGATVLKNLGAANLSEMRSELEKIDKPSPDMVITLDRLPQTPQAKKAIEYAREEAQRLKHNYVDTEHILLGLLHQPVSTANKILRNLKIKPKEVREEVMNLLGETGKKTGKKKERPVKCKFFEAREYIKMKTSGGEVLKSTPEGFSSETIKKAITEFLSDKEFTRAAQSSVILEKALPPLIITKYTIFYRDKEKGS